MSGTTKRSEAIQAIRLGMDISASDASSIIDAITAYIVKEVGRPDPEPKTIVVAPKPTMVWEPLERVPWNPCVYVADAAPERPVYSEGISGPDWYTRHGKEELRPAPQEEASAQPGFIDHWGGHTRMVMCCPGCKSAMWIWTNDPIIIPCPECGKEFAKSDFTPFVEVYPEYAIKPKEASAQPAPDPAPLLVPENELWETDGWL